mmetsp:Transcript_5660/g.7771  ORF Transcript_5660/g.7771 Transcript_5660/m.7771 type:complete len:307 (+) Transcript_5660:77-997(+)
MRPTEGQSSNKDTHEKTSFGIVGGWHETQNQSKHDHHFRSSLVLRRHLPQDCFGHKGRKGKDRNISANNEKSNSGGNGQDDIDNSRISLERGELTEDDKSNHVVNDGCRDDELSYGCVHDFSLSKDVHGDAETGGTKGGTCCDRCLGVVSQRKGDGEGDCDGCNGTDYGDDNSSCTDKFERGQIDIYSSLQHEQNQTNFAQQHKGLGIWNVISKGRAQQDPRKNLSHQTGHLQQLRRNNTSYVYRCEENHRRVQIFVCDMHAKFRVTVSVLIVATATSQTTPTAEVMLFCRAVFFHVTPTVGAVAA